MVITEEIIAAYVEGKLSGKEREEVLHYMVIHPEIQDVVLALLDESDLEENPSENLSPVRTEQSFSDIAYAAAAFAPRTVVNHQLSSEAIEGLIDERLNRILNFGDEVQNSD